MFWVIVLGLTLPGPKGKPLQAPVLVPPAVAFVAEDQCVAAVKAIMAKIGSKSLGCAEVTVNGGKKQETF